MVKIFLAIIFYHHQGVVYMSISSFLKDILIYHEPRNTNPFELLESEPEDGQGNKMKDSDALEQGSSDSDGADSDKPTAGVVKPSKRPVKVGQKKKPASVDDAKGQDDEKESLSRDLSVSLDIMKRQFNHPDNQDVVIREFKALQQKDAFIIYIDGMADSITINDYVLRQLMRERKIDTGQLFNLDYINKNLLPVNQIETETDIEQITRQILNGLTALFIDGDAECTIIETRGYEMRAVSTPTAENVIQGPQEAFVENLRTNLTLVRRIIRNKDLVTEMLPMGKADNLTCAILYINGIINPQIVKEVRRRIKSLSIDFIPGSGALEQLIEDNPFSLFPQILSTERPDRTASFLMDGQAAIICEGGPFALIIPITFSHLMHTSEDTLLRWHYGTFLRLIRMTASFFAIFLPGLYIALTLYHPEMIPTDLLNSLTEAREIIPFPAFVELLFMEIAFELIREASLRVPGAIGQTLGIIGAVVLGQAAVSANIVSPILIIVVAMTGMSSFAIPNFSISFGFRILRFVFLLFGAIAGFYGIAAAIIILGGMASSMKSFGVPYFSPVAPVTKSNMDIYFRGPLWKQNQRPDFLNTENRQQSDTTIRGWIK